MSRNRISDWLIFGTIVLRKKKTISVTTFRRFFKLHPRLCEKVFLRLTKRYAHQEQHLLWCLFYLKSRDPLDSSIAQSLGIDQGTMRKHVYLVLEELRLVMPKVCASLALLQFTISFSGETDSMVGIIDHLPALLTLLLPRLRLLRFILGNIGVCIIMLLALSIK